MWIQLTEPEDPVGCSDSCRGVGVCIYTSSLPPRLARLQLDISGRKNIIDQEEDPAIVAGMDHAVARRLPNRSGRSIIVGIIGQEECTTPWPTRCERQGAMVLSCFRLLVAEVVLLDTI